MNDNSHNIQLIDELIAIAKEAGEAILEVYNSDFDYQMKEDSSPLTKADTISHNIISKKLKELTPEIPILSEEDSDIPFEIRSKWIKYWLIDPLDGTKEFIKKNGEFTVNIALIENCRPILGVIFMPISSETFWGSKDNGSFYKKNNKIVQMNVTKDKNNDLLKIATSRSHPSNDLDSFLKRFSRYEIIKAGSSIKFCLVALGKADIYPRLSPTCEWDIAAGHAIAENAGATLINIDGSEVLYNRKESYLNNSFFVFNDLLKNHNINPETALLKK
jgi:3'(2'), 5'-bisphosphate nucleotidase|tara:strand:- start:5693 stop:6517 length:825 start_codon:yes stop_codon:yes gene_type:complete